MNILLSSRPVALETSITFVRIITGLLMLFHGLEVFNAQKIAEYSTWDSFKTFENPVFMAYVGKGAEFLAGLLLTIGWFTRVGALLLICIMAYITFKISEGRFWYEDQHPFLFLLLGIVFLFAGGGKFSLDKKTFG